MKACLLTAMLLAGCGRTVETASRPTTVRLHFVEPCAAELHVEGPIDDRQRGPIQIVDGRVQIDVPSMGGGYSETAGHQSNVHDPRTYAIIEISHGEAVKKLSLADVEALPHDETGDTIVSDVCK